LKKVAVLQSNYIPWKGYFDIMHDVDLFVFYDDVQYTKNDWRNRNRIKTQNGAAWLTIPTGTDLDRLICEVLLPDERWAKNHYKTLVQNYAKAPFFRQYQPLLEEVYLARRWETLSELNQYLIQTIALDCLGMTIEFADSRRYEASGKCLDRLLDLLGKCGATHYLSGPAAQDYIDQAAFNQAGIELSYKDYSGYPEYPQFFPPFDHYVTILDLLFHTGPDAPYYIWGWRSDAAPLTTMVPLKDVR
jgi:hypothetical protein